MKKLRTKRLTAAVMAGVLTAGMLAGCGSKKAEAVKEGEDPWIEFTFVARDPDTAQRIQVKPGEDVVTPYLENKFHIRLKEVVQGPKDSTIEQNVAMWDAADNMPDIIECDSSAAANLRSTGMFADLTDYIKEYMPDYIKTCWPEEYWDRTNFEGRQYSVMSFDTMKNPPVDPESDPYDEGVYAHGLVVREDILEQMGYQFTPVAELQKTTTDLGIKPTEEQLAIVPAIDSPEAFYEFLNKIKEAGLTTPSGQEVIPLTLQGWMTHHLGCMFDFGRWRIDSTGDVDGMLGTPGAKDYMHFLNQIYREGLLDNDYILQEANQYQEKIGSGVAACAFYAGFDIKAAEQSLQMVNPDARLRFIPWPKKDKDLGWYDVQAPEGYWHTMIRKDMPPEDIKRMCQFWNYMFTDEGQDLVSWGPEEAGLWKMVDGKKQFADPEVESDCLNLVRNAKGVDYYGLCEKSIAAREQNFSPLVLTCPGTINYSSFFRSYPPVLDFHTTVRNMLGSAGQNKDGSAANGDGSEGVSAVDNYYWGEFMSKDLAKILQATTEEEFETAWKEVEGAFMTKTNYQEAKTAMTAYFKKFPPIGNK